MTKVSVIVPVYNAEKYISKCVESVLAQTYKNIELILINDGSKDRSKEILDDYASKYEEKIVVVHQKNIGVANTRNKGIKLATGKYIMFIDNDDYIDKDYIETFVKAAEKNKSDVVIGGYRRKDENGKETLKVSLKDYQWSRYIVLAPWAKIYNKSYLLKNNIEFLDNNIGEDVYFNVQVMNLTSKIKIIDYIGYNWFCNTSSVSSTTQKSIKKLDILKLLNSTYDVIKEKNILSKNYEVMEFFFIKYLLWLLTFSTKKHDYKTISKEYDKLFNWMEKHFPKYKKNKLVGINKPKGELILIRISLFIFMTMHKLKLGKLLIYLYSKI